MTTRSTCTSRFTTCSRAPPTTPLIIMLMGALMEVMRDFAHAVGGERNDFTITARRRLLDCLRRHDAEGAAAALAEHLDSLQHALPRSCAPSAAVVPGE